MIPMLVGGVVAILGFGGGLTAFYVARSEVAPLREEAAAAKKKTEDAELQAQSAEAGKVAAEARLADLEKAAKASEPAIKAAQAKAAAAEKKVAQMKQQIDEFKAAQPAPPRRASPTRIRLFQSSRQPCLRPSLSAVGIGRRRQKSDSERLRTNPAIACESSRRRT